MKKEAQKYLDELVTIFEFLEEDKLINSVQMEQVLNNIKAMEAILKTIE